MMACLTSCHVSISVLRRAAQCNQDSGENTADFAIQEKAEDVRELRILTICAASVYCGEDTRC